MAMKYRVKHMKHIIKTDRLCLKPLCESDIEFMQELEARPETYEYDRGTALPSDQFQKVCHWFIENSKALPDQGAIRWIATYDDVKIGEVHINCNCAEVLEWEIGWHLLPEYGGKGLATEAVNAIIKYAFTHFKIHRLVALCCTENSKSIALAQRVGMHREGRLRENILIKGLYHDEYLYSILRHEVVITSSTLSLFSHLSSQYMVKSLLHRNHGKLETANNSAMITWGPSLMIGGEFSDEICVLLKKRLQEAKMPCSIYVPEGEWTSYIEKSFSNNITEKHIHLYQHKGPHGDAGLAASPYIVPITDTWLQQNPSNAQLIKDEIYSYLTVEDFLQNGYGLALVIDGKLCGYCLSEYSIDNECAITIWVDEKHRGLGYAKMMTRLFLQYSQGKGWTVYWGCDEDNMPSNRVALSTGFRLHSRQRYYEWGEV